MKLFKTTVILTALSLSLSVVAADIDLILVRHAEKLNGSDPSLNNIGQERARSLIHLEAKLSLNFEGVYTSNTSRAIETARPLARAFDLKIKNSISPFDFSNLYKSITKDHSQGAILIVGHSNTIPRFINFIKPKINLKDMRESHYSRLFHLKIVDDEVVTFNEYDFSPLENDVLLIKKI